jgi:hypothetical protein
MLGLAHMLRADHSHSYCDEHEQFEDIPLGQTGEAPSGNSHEGTPLALASGLPPSGPTSHAACPFLNQGALLTAPLPASAQTSTAILQEKSIAVPDSRQADFHACPLLLAAPKTSPPFDLG